MSEWIKHDGSCRPVHEYQKVSVKFRDGWTDENHKSHPFAIYWDDSQELSPWIFKEGSTQEVDIVEYCLVEK